MGVYDCDNYNDLMARIDKVKTPIRQFNSPTQMSGTSDTISRQDAIDVVSEGCQEWRGIFERCKEKLLSLPSAQSERKTGKWIEVNDADNRISGRCSICGWESHMYEDDVVGMDYCPNCGARLEDIE